jgi:hypothetical protein
MGPLKILNRGSLRVSRRVTFLGGMIPTRIAIHAGGRMAIGEECLFNYGVMIDVAGVLTIGSHCMFASMVEFKCFEGEIAVGNEVWIAHGATIGPGVTIGEGSVVGAGSVVTHCVPAHSLALGAPARNFPLETLAPLDRGPGRWPARSTLCAGGRSTNPPEIHHDATGAHPLFHHRNLFRRGFRGR